MGEDISVQWSAKEGLLAIGQTRPISMGNLLIFGRTWANELSLVWLQVNGLVRALWARESVTLQGLAAWAPSLLRLSLRIRCISLTASFSQRCHEWKDLWRDIDIQRAGS